MEVIATVFTDDHDRKVNDVIFPGFPDYKRLVLVHQKTLAAILTLN